MSISAPDASALFQIKGVTGILLVKESTLCPIKSSSLTTSCI